MTAELETLSQAIERLVVFGGAAALPELHPWLLSCGIAQTIPGQPWVVPAISYLRSVLPSRDRLDLLRKSAIRDPKYRLHLDLTLARVIQVIARGERWRRFEELSFGVLRPLSQRLLGLIEWAAEYTEKSPLSLTEANWIQFERELLADCLPRFHSWDNHLWGQARDAAELFPLLEDLYLPLAAQPIHFCPTGQQALLLMSLIEAARAEDGLMLMGTDGAICKELKRAGVPILHRAGSQICSLTGNIELSVDGSSATPGASMQSVPLGLPALAKRSRIRVTTQESSWLKPSAPSAWVSTATFLSVCPVSETWHDAPLSEAPPWTVLPKSSALSESAFLKKSLGLEEALLSLDRHPLYGLLLQFLISEALDRELGDETLLLAPPLDKTGTEAEWGTTVLYRPAAKSETGFQSIPQGYLNLGPLDEVLTDIAQHLTLETLPLPYAKTGYGLWSWALHLLIELKAVVGQRDRWTLHPTLHDHLYTGTLMANVLRDRRDTRRSIHLALRRLWQLTSTEERESTLAEEVRA